MLGFLRRWRRKRLTREQLETLQTVSRHVVLSLENSVLGKRQKRDLAIRLTGELMVEFGVDILPPLLASIAVDSAFRSTHEPPVPRAGLAGLGGDVIVIDDPRLLGDGSDDDEEADWMDTDDGDEAGFLGQRYTGNWFFQDGDDYDC